MRAARLVTDHEVRPSDHSPDAFTSSTRAIGRGLGRPLTWHVCRSPASSSRLHEIVDTAHARGQDVRFWATPDVAGPARDALWRELVVADVDVLNTHDLAGLQRFLLAEDPAEQDAAAA